MGRTKGQKAHGGSAMAGAGERMKRTPAGVAVSAMPASQSQSQYLSECARGQQLLDRGQAADATQVFEAILASLDGASRFERTVVLGRLGRCHHLQGQATSAADCLREAIAIAAELTPTDRVNSVRSALHSELGDALRAAGEHTAAKQAYDEALAIARKSGNLRGQGVDLVRLAALAFDAGDYQEALVHYRAAHQIAKAIRDPLMEAATSVRLGKILQSQRQWAQARHYLSDAASLAEQAGDRARASDIWCLLAQISEEEFLPAEAERWYRKVIAYARQAGRLQYLVQQLGRLAELLLGQPDGAAEARVLADEALAVVQTLEPAVAGEWVIFETLGNLAARDAADTAEPGRKLALEARAGELRDLAKRAPQLFATLAQLDASPGLGRAVILGRIGRCLHVAGQAARAVAYTQEAVAIAGALPGSGLAAGLRGALEAQLGAIHGECGDLLAAKRAFQAALAVAETLEDLRGQAICHEELATIAALAGRPDELLAQCHSASTLLAQQYDPAAQVAALVRLGCLLQAGQHCERARYYYGEAERIGQSEGQPEAVAMAQELLAMLDPVPAQEDPTRSDDTQALDVEVTLIDDVTTDFAFGTDLLVDGWRERKVTRWAGPPAALREQVRPMLRPCTRNWTDESGVAWLSSAVEEPAFVRQAGCTVIRRARREIGVAGSPRIVARLVRAMDGEHTVAQILNQFSQPDGSVAARLLAAMIEAGAIDMSGRAVARLLHAATKKGVLPGGGLEGDDILGLAMDGGHRCYPQAARLPVSQATPECLRPLHALTRTRRSRRHFSGAPVARNAFDALLDTACGVTGVMQWEGRQSNLRAYPSSGGLYAVEVYAMALQIEGLVPAVYHYRADESELELVKPLAPGLLLEAMLPVEREMVSGAAVMFCLTGCFPRHEHKYGEGGYRMLAAEAGHISQSLILAATSLGLSARPFGGVFDDLVNEDLGLDSAQEQFLLGVLVGQAPQPG